MFSLSYVILPFSDDPPAEALRASLAPFQRGGRGDLPESRLTFHDETEALQCAHQARMTFTEQGGGGMRIEGCDPGSSWYVDTEKVRCEMRRRGLRLWRVRFADAMHLGEFYAGFGRGLERCPDTGRFGKWLNPLGRWDWWDLGGRFDGRILGDRRHCGERGVAQVSSGVNPGRTLLARIEDRLAEALNQEPLATVEVRSDQNVELVATLLEDARSGRENAYPGSLVLPPGVVDDSLRWIDTWPGLGPAPAITWLGLSSEASWTAIVNKTYALFENHWAAGVAYHH